MPRGWRPFSPCRWLADWLTAAANRPPPGSDPRDGGGGAGAEGEGGEGPGRGPGKSLEDMDREEKLAYIFAQIDANGSGWVRVDCKGFYVHTHIETNGSGWVGGYGAKGAEGACMAGRWWSAAAAC